jgi:hypothetical protein
LLHALCVSVHTPLASAQLRNSGNVSVAAGPLQAQGGGHEVARPKVFLSDSSHGRL